MEKIVIIGEEPLQGTIAISGSKNASLPLMAASILTDETITLNNTPNLADIHTMGSVLDSLGVNFDKTRFSHGGSRIQIFKNCKSKTSEMRTAKDIYI